jgi:sterol desaturase/sphingolipid hydroxylase (fatty acid hydroxylase superfamily)
MEFINTILKEIKGFLGYESALNIIDSGNYEALLTYNGFTSIIGPLIPLLLILEFILGVIYKNPHGKVYKVNFLIYVLNRFISRFISIGVIAFLLAHLPKYALFQTTFTWYWFIYGYIVWEFSHFVYHFLGHKVRLFWCLHSTHHAPEHMNLSVTYTHFFLEGPYADFIRGSICLLAGIHPALLFTIMFVDGTWGAFIHVGENLFKDGTLGINKLGFIGKYILSPSDHRVHHAKNPLYIDTNYCNLLNIWDRVFGTYQPEQKDIKIDYGITRDINTNNVLDVYFGEIWELIKDIGKAGSLKNAFLLIFMPPGWSPTGDHKTAKVVRDEYFKGVDS